MKYHDHGMTISYIFVTKRAVPDAIYMMGIDFCSNLLSVRLLIRMRMYNTKFHTRAHFKLPPRYFKR